MHVGASRWGQSMSKLARLSCRGCFPKEIALKPKWVVTGNQINSSGSTPIVDCSNQWSLFEATEDGNIIGKLFPL